MEIQKEYERVRALFDGCEDRQLELLDGLFREAARLRVELDMIHEKLKVTGPILTSPKNPAMQRISPAANLAVKYRASYLNTIAKLSGILGKTAEDEDLGLEEFE